MDWAQCPEPIRQLFFPEERIHALLFSDQALPLSPDDPKLPSLHPCQTIEEARAAMETNPVQMILCDLPGEQRQTYLNREDIDSPGRDFMNDMRSQHPDIPLLLLERAERPFSEEEKESYLRRGARGFIAAQGEALRRDLEACANIIIQQNSLSNLARSNQLIQFETAQSINESGEEARILLYDLKLVKSIKAADAGNVLSLLSTPNVHFSDIIGAEEAIKELRYFVRYMKKPEQFRAKGAPAPKGLLLYGPPGTGKTMLAKAFAAESGATFIATEGTQFFKRYWGEGPDLVRRLFATARRYAPSVLFIDEIDTIARSRTDLDSNASPIIEEIMTTFFAEMDGFRTHPDKPVFVLGATNYGVRANDPLRLDPAMLRRFDRHILVELPKLENRVQFLTRQISQNPLFRVSPPAIDSIAQRSTGMSLAQLSSVLNLAVRSVMQQDSPLVTDAVLEEAFETFNSGEEKKWSPETTLRTARHEAGHVLISWLAGEKPSYATIVSRGDFGGYMQHANQENRMGYTRQELLNKIRTALGGRAAEIVYYGPEGGVSTGASGDLKSATDTAMRMLSTYGMDDQFGLAVFDQGQAGDAVSQDLRTHINALLKTLLEEAVQSLQARKDQLDALTDALLRCNSLRTDDMEKILGA